MTERHVVLRADASASVGTGHLVRCRTLAEALIARGWRASLLTRDAPIDLADGLSEAGIAVIRLPSGAIASEPVGIADRVGRDVTLVVGDHYELVAEWYRGIGQELPGAVLMAIDDLADRPLPVDVVLNQNLPEGSAAYVGLVSPATRVLLGPMHALVRPAFTALRERGRVRDGLVDRVLVFMSGADTADVTARAAVGLAGLGRRLDIVVGAAYPNLATLREIVARQPSTELHVNIDAMASLMDQADLAVGAPGSASWERCTLRLPAVLVRLADNQLAIERLLVDAGAAVSIGSHEAITASDVERAVGALCLDPARVAAMSEAAGGVTDGGGTDRVVAAIDALVAERNGTKSR